MTPSTKKPVDSSHNVQAASESGGSFVGHLRASIAVTIILTIICCGIYPLVIWGISQAIFPGKANGSLVKKDGTYTTRDEEAVGSSLIGQNFSASAPGYFRPRPSAAGSGYDPTSSAGSNLGPLSDKLINGATATTMPTAATPAPATQPVADATIQPSTQAAAASTQPVESLAYDGVRLRTIHYAVENNIPFKLYMVKPDGTRTEVPLKNFQDAQGNLNDMALVDAFPHPPSDAADKTTLIAADFGKLIPGDAVTASGSGLDPHISPENAEIQKSRVASARKITEQQVEELIVAHTDGRDFGVLGDPGVNVLMLNLALDAKYPVPAAPATQPAVAAQLAPTTQPAVH